MNDELKGARERLLGQIATRAEGEVDLPVSASGEPSVSPHIAQTAGPPDHSAEYFADIAHPNSRREAIREYRRTLEEFRQTGRVHDKEWADFAHLINPPGLQLDVFDAHQRAALDIEHWQGEQAEAPVLPPVEKEMPARGEARGNVFVRAGAPDEDRSPASKNDECTQGLTALPSSRSEGQDHAGAVVPQGVSLAVESPQPGGLLRGVPFDPDAPGRMAAYEPAIPQLALAPAPERLPAADEQTEALLNAIIGECHFFMREVAFPSLCHARTADDRMGWIGKAVHLAETSAKVGKAVARLRHGPDVKETRHTSTIVQNRVDAGQGGGG